MAEPVYMEQGSKNASKLEPEHQEYVLQQLAEGYKPKQVQERLRKEYGIELSIDGVDYYQREKKERILEKRRALATQMDRLRASSKFVRVMDLEEQEDRLKDNREMEDKFKERLLLDNKEQQRKEIEGFKGSLSLEGDNPFEALASKADLQAVNRRLEDLKKKTAKG